MQSEPWKHYVTLSCTKEKFMNHGKFTLFIDEVHGIFHWKVYVTNRTEVYLKNDI